MREVLNRGNDDPRLPLVRDQEGLYQMVYVRGPVEVVEASPKPRDNVEIAKAAIAGAIVIGVVRYAMSSPKRIEVKHEEEKEEARAALLAAGE